MKPIRWQKHHVQSSTHNQLGGRVNEKQFPAEDTALDQTHTCTHRESPGRLAFVDQQSSSSSSSSSHRLRYRRRKSQSVQHVTQHKSDIPFHFHQHGSSEHQVLKTLV
ncbi:unnamed protein product [Ectocarpus sp. 12 AP-2014]